LEYARYKYTSDEQNPIEAFESNDSTLTAAIKAKFAEFDNSLQSHPHCNTKENFWNLTDVIFSLGANE